MAGEQLGLDRVLSRPSWDSISRPLVLAAIVDTLCFPALAILALFGGAMFGFSVHSLMTFGGAFGDLAGIALWWAIGLVPALVYTALCAP